MKKFPEMVVTSYQEMMRRILTEPLGDGWKDDPAFVKAVCNAAAYEMAGDKIGVLRAMRAYRVCRLCGDPISDHHYGYYCSSECERNGESILRRCCPQSTGQNNPTVVPNGTGDTTKDRNKLQHPRVKLNDCPEDTTHEVHYFRIAIIKRRRGALVKWKLRKDEIRSKWSKP